MSDTSEYAADLLYQEKSLQDVSRTFALTIPQLPERLRVVVGNAYLLCRIADTIEDSPDLPVDDKRRFCDAFVGVVEGTGDAAAFGRDLAAKLDAGSTIPERDLIENTPRVIRLTHGFRAEERAALARCVRIMSGGMEEFQEGRFTNGLHDLAQLDAYCYHVAGVVGEMLCDLFCAHAPEVAAQKDGLSRYAVSFGQGLQMTNILKDVWEDKLRNVCWLPRDVFAKHGFDLNTLHPGKNGPGFEAGLNELIGITRGHLENALEYTVLIPKSQPGMRRFCLWAIGMALLTLRKLHNNPDYARGAQVKISRRSVKAVIVLSNAACRHDAMLRLLFRAAAAGLPSARA